jgi:hypothetical protein
MLRTIIDVVKVETVYDEDGNYKQVTLTDYKSSWRTPPEMLDNLQRRCQAVCAWIKYNPDVLILEIANLRTLHHHSRTINCHHEEQLLHTWLKDIMQAAHVAMTDLAPKPGLNCIKCPYVLSCTHRHYALNNSNNIAAQYATALATVKELEPKIKALCKDKKITTPNGAIGFMATERKSAMKDAHATVFESWTQQGGKPEDLIAWRRLPNDSTQTQMNATPSSNDASSKRTAHGSGFIKADSVATPDHCDEPTCNSIPVGSG